MSEPPGAAGSQITAEVIPQLTAAAAQIAAAYEEPAPTSIAPAPTNRVKALDLLFRGSTVPASHSVSRSVTGFKIAMCGLPIGTAGFEPATP